MTLQGKSMQEVRKMSKIKIRMSASEFSQIIISSILGVGILYIPNGLIKYANQDAWIACIIGAVYPFYMLIIAKYMCSKHPEENILMLSRRYFGTIIGNLFNIVYVSYFIFVFASEVNGFKNAFYTYVTYFIDDFKIILVTLLATGYLVYKGLKPLARVNEIIFYTTIILIVLPSGALINGSIYNIKPTFDISIIDLLKASKETTFFYAGIETIFLFYPFLDKKDKMFKYGAISIIFIAIVYVWTVFLTIFYFGIDISPKYLWPVVALTDAINIPIINSFRYIFLSLWSLIIFKCIAVFYYSVCYGINQITNKISIQKLTVIIYPLIAYMALKFGNPIERRELTGSIMPIYVLFNLFFVTVTAIIIRRERGVEDEKE
jgi:spore germination protein